MKIPRTLLLFDSSKEIVNFLMKTFFFFVYGSLLALNPYNGHSQDALVKIDKDTHFSAENVFDLIQSQTDYQFFYNYELIKKVQKINLKPGYFKTKDLLDKSLEASGLTYEFTDNVIIVRKATPADLRTADKVQEFITGTVTDEQGNPLMGVSVFFENSQIGTATTPSGTFRLEKAPGYTILVFQYLGFITQKIEVNETTVFNIVLKVDLNELDAVDLVVNTGMSRRDVRNFTGAAVTMTGEELKQISATNVLSAITALDPSIRILPDNIAGGDINNVPRLNVRGTNSFPNLTGELSSDPNTPLIILDGFEVNLERIYDLDINLINTITILKDASATAIYGSRGANGVLVITTLAPQPGQLRVTVNNDFNIMNPRLDVYNYLNSEEKLDFEQRAGLYTYDGTDLQYVYGVLYNERLKAVTSGVDTDWARIPVQTGYGNQTSIYVQGGDEVIRYGVHGSADFQNGVMKGQDRNNYSGQFDLSYRLENLRFSNSIRIFQNESNASPYGDFSEYLRLNPYWAPYDENGNPKRYLESMEIANRRFQETNPLYDATLNSVDKSEYFGYTNNFQIRYDIIPSLFLETRLSISKRNTQAEQFFSAEDSRFNEILDVNQKGSYSKTNTNSFSYENLTSLNLNLFKGKSQWFSMLALNLSSNSTDFYTLVAEGFPYDQLDNLLFAAQYQANSAPTGDESTVRRLGVVYSGNYSYDNRFLADLSFRRDGSSQYGSDRRFGTFWSVGLGWNIHNEPIFEDQDWINRFKIRGSYGSTGSTNIPAYGAQTRYGYGVYSLYNGEIGAALTNLGNRSLSWQNVYKFNTGIDATLFQEKLDARIDYYIEDTKDALTQVTLPGSSGFESYAENLGSIRNEGFEFALRYKLLEDRSKRLLWSVNVNGFTNTNVLKELSNRLSSANDNLNDLNEDQTTPNVLFREGESINTLYVVPSLGVDPMTGSEVFLKQDGTTTYIWDASDKVAFGVTDPKWNGVFGTNFMLHGFEFGMLLDYRFGGQIYNQTLANRVESVDPRYNVDQRAYDLGWTEPGDISDFTRITPNKIPTKLTSRFVQDEDVVNLSSISLAYNFDPEGSILNRLGINAGKLTFLANDVYSWSSIDIERGTSNPYAKTYSISLRVNF